MLKYIIFVFVSFVFLSCGSNSSCSMDDKKRFIYDVMHDSYLWADETPFLSEQNISEHKDEEALLKTLLHSKDISRKGNPFSHILTKKAHDDFFEAGVEKGFGYFPSLAEDENGTELINVDFVYPSSPASRIGLKRGDLIATFDGYSIEEIRRSETLFNRYFGDSDENITTEILLIDSREFNLSNEEFNIKTVLHQSVIEQNSTKIGYLVFQSFIGTSQKELEQSFTDFKEQGISELVLDLRYNGGGYVYIANYLSSLIGGNRVEGTIFNQVQYNQKYSSLDEIDYFEKIPENALNLSRVFIITTERSCSASELVINAFRANSNSVEVIQIGSSTCGKPYGMSGMEYCGKIILPVQFESVNGDGVGGYVDGIAPMCVSIDDKRKDFGNTQEASLSSALFYIGNNQCRRDSRVLNHQKTEDILTGFRKMYGIY